VLIQPLTRHELRELRRLLTPIRDHMRATPPRSASPTPQGH
jgi:hypothetical protein